jgi:isopentenyldiphosphate isomerase
VFIGRCDGPVRINREEIAEWRWANPEVLHKELSAGDTAKYTPWFRMEWARVWRDYRGAVLALGS